MTLTTLKTKLQTAVAGITSIKTVQVGYLTELNTGQESFDILLLIPPDDLLDSNVAAWTNKEMILKLFLIRIDPQNDETARIAAWDALTANMKTIVKALVADPANFQVLSPPRPVMRRNSGGADTGLPIAESVIWVELNMNVKAVDCA
jgi:hypothetical protein